MDLETDIRINFVSIILAVIVVCAGLVTGLALKEKELTFVMGNLNTVFRNIKFTFEGIFIHNLISALFILAGGFLLSFPSIILCYINFLVIGAFLQAGAKNLTPFQVLISLLPHGIFEIPAIIFSFVLSVNLTYYLIKAIFSKDVKASRVLKYHTLLFTIVVIPLLVVAAVIEVYITPLLIKKIF